MKLYLASSWRNPSQTHVLRELRSAGFTVYDFKNPEPGNSGFSWASIHPDWLNWDAHKFIHALSDPRAEYGFYLDWTAMKEADAGVLVLPCGRSAHLEAGYFVGAKKPLVILLLGTNEPELMYKMANAICTSTSGVIDFLNGLEAGSGSCANLFP